MLNLFKKYAHEHIKNPSLSEYYVYESVQKIIKPDGQSEESYLNKIFNTNIVNGKIGFLMIKPGETFSFWKIVGAPGNGSGFKKGAMLKDHVLIYENAGGLCQISSALYSAALHFGCKIVQRLNHSSDIYGDERYFTLGQDATIAYPRPNLQFANKFDQTIILNSIVENDLIKVRFFSTTKPCEVKVESKILKIIPYEQGNGCDGKIVETVRTLIFPNGKEVKEKISEDFYRPVAKLRPT